MENKNVHILVPKGFQGKELLRATQGINHDASDKPAEGECIKCKGTGAVLHKVWLENYRVIDGKIVEATPKMAWTKCKCYMGQFWLKFHPLNVQARLMPKWGKEAREMLEREKADIINKCGGNYTPGQDTFLDDIGYKPPQETALQKSFKEMNFGGIIS